MRTRLQSIIAPLLVGIALVLCSVPAAAKLLVLSYHDIRDDVARKGDPDLYAISTQNFAAHLDWLKGNGYTAVSLDDLVAASRGERTLPQRAVLLTFDDGLRSTYTRAFPLLRAYGFPAVVAPVTSWVDLPPGRTINYGPRPFDHDDFLTWAQLREMHDSGLVEVASHTHDLHTGVLANPQRNEIPSAVTRRFDPDTRSYESQEQYLARIRADLATSAQEIESGIGMRPRSVVWPYAAYSSRTNDIADDLGMEISFDLEGVEQSISAERDAGLHGLSRLLVFDNPTVEELVRALRAPGDAEERLRAIQVDLDYVYDPDPKQVERNLDVLIERISRIQPSHVFLQAFADPDGDGAADALYFPNRHLPMRADLFARVAWQLRTRAEVKVYAWLPVLAYKPADATLRSSLALADAEPGEVFRLDPTDPRARRLVGEIYEDLAIASPIDGLHFHDDALLRETELPELAAGDPVARTQYLIAFTDELRRAAEQWRPKLRTSRNLFARPVLEPASEAWFAQSLPAFLPAYDHTVIMAMPHMEGSDRPLAWFDRLAAAVAAQPGALARTAFQLQTIDWRDDDRTPGALLPADTRRLQAAGVRHLAYYPDDFIGDRPTLENAREAISARSFPYLRDQP
ncbi:poly-beta-1,6-N-acetyl-D-glucosamine N-deacetylase PgaB [Lysobacter sp. D1-1-M9]|uniref:poly-beta-1,6-N-acetyl-D-glucosamine N-deacetylase PgaB n=1 Tax=Novilysobacter longmucuonensis TaxID=3098603 RepID=UPI002FC7A123